MNIVSSTESIYEKFVFKAFASNVSNSMTVHAVTYKSSLTNDPERKWTTEVNWIRSQHDDNLAFKY